MSGWTPLDAGTMPSSTSTQLAAAPFDLRGLKTEDLQARPSQVFVEDLGRPLVDGATVDEWVDSLPLQHAGGELRRVRDHLIRAHGAGRTIVAAVDGPVILNGCGPYLVDWINRGLLSAVAMTGAAAVHDIELALAGKTGENVAEQVQRGRYGVAREAADVFAVAALSGAEDDRGLGRALGDHLEQLDPAHDDCSVLLAAHRAGIPCTVHVALGADTVHLHPHVDAAALGAASMLDFRRLISVATTLSQGGWLNLDETGGLAETLLQAVAVASNFGHSLAGLVTVQIGSDPRSTTAFEQLDWAVEALQLDGPPELLLPLVHAALAGRLAARPLQAAHAA